MRHSMILAAAVICLGAAPAKPPVKTPPKPATAAAAPTSAAPPSVAPASTDPTNPQTLIDLLAALGAKGVRDEKVEDVVYLRVTTPNYGFASQFAGCDAQGRNCKAMAFTTQAGTTAVTLAELNAFNQTSLTCRVWQDKAGKPHVMYSTLVSPGDTIGELQTHLGAWQGCLVDFGDFLKDPKAYLAASP